MSDKPLVSIIITNFNYAQFIGECIESCLAQTYKNMEILVVDDCSTDGSLDIITSFRYSSLRDLKTIQLNKNKGCFVAKNEGIKASRGEYLVFIDADDMLLHDSVELRMKEFEKNPKLDFVHGLAYRYRYKKGKWQKDGYRKNAVIHAQTVAIRRRVFEKYGLFYEKLRSKGDKEMWVRLGIHRDYDLPRRIKTKKIEEFLALYRKHENQLHKVRKRTPEFNEQTLKIFKRRIKQLKKEGITEENTEFL